MLDSFFPDINRAFPARDGVVIRIAALTACFPGAWIVWCWWVASGAVAAHECVGAPSFCMAKFIAVEAEKGVGVIRSSSNTVVSEVEMRWNSGSFYRDDESSGRYVSAVDLFGKLFNRCYSLIL